MADSLLDRVQKRIVALIVVLLRPVKWLDERRRDLWAWLVDRWSGLKSIGSGVRSVAAPVARWTIMPFVWADRALRWTWRQLTGIVTGTVEYFQRFHFDDVLPPSIRDLLNYIFFLLPRAFGIRDTTRKEQIDANVVLIAITFLTGFVTGGLAWAIIAVWLVLLAFAWFFRATPAGESYWTRVRDIAPGNIDIPLWRSD